MSNKRTTRKVNVRVVDQIDSGQETLEKKDELSETFLLGNISDLLYEIKRLATIIAATKSIQTKKDSIARLKLILGRYRDLLGYHLKEIISDFITETFKSRKISRHDLRKIVAWWLREALKINN